MCVVYASIYHIRVCTHMSFNTLYAFTCGKADSLFMSVHNVFNYFHMTSMFHSVLHIVHVRYRFYNCC